MGIRELFSDRYGPPMTSAVMHRNCFAFMLHNLSFDDKSTPTERWKKDRVNVICVFFEKLNNQCMLVLAPGDYLSLDELFILCEHRYRSSSSTRVSQRSTAFSSNL